MVKTVVNSLLHGSDLASGSWEQHYTGTNETCTYGDVAGSKKRHVGGRSAVGNWRIQMR